MSTETLAIATAPKKDSKHWDQGEVTFAELVAWAENPADHKECGNYVLGTLKGPRRNKESIVSRSAITLDADDADAELREDVKALPYVVLLHPTYSSAPDAPRYRIIIPLSRSVLPPEYRRIVTGLMDRLGPGKFDPGSVQPERLMFKPSTQDEEHYLEHLLLPDKGKPFAEADALLADAPELDDEGDEALPDAPEQYVPPLTEQRPDYVKKAVRRHFDEFLVPLTELGEDSTIKRVNPRTGEIKEYGWEENGGLQYGARRLVELSNAAPSTYSQEAAEADFLALDPGGFAGKFAHHWSDAVKAVGARAATPSQASAEDDFGPLGPDAGHTVAGGDHSDGKRHLVVQRASEITPRKVVWLWDGRMALGTLSLLAGREGLGKSSLIAWLVARITLGTLPGHLQGSPRAVIIAATEDSWEHTLVPRLMAAGADLNLVLRVDVMTSKGITVDLSLPDDIPSVKELAEQERVALMVLDPLMSRLHNLDTHKDAEVRIALEPLVRMADEVHMSLVGLIHLNKSSNDPLNAVMGSKAFTAVARSVSTVVPDDSDEDDRRRLFGTVKNNLGPAMNNSQIYTIETADVDTPDGPTPVGKLVWHGEADTSIKAAMADPGMDHRSAVQEATVWLLDYLTQAGPDAVKRKTVIAAAGKEGISESSAKRAASKLQVISEPSGFPRTTYWSLPEDFEPIAEGDE